MHLEDLRLGLSHFLLGLLLQSEDLGLRLLLRPVIPFNLRVRVLDMRPADHRRRLFHLRNPSDRHTLEGCLSTVHLHIRNFLPGLSG